MDMTAQEIIKQIRENDYINSPTVHYVTPDVLDDLEREFRVMERALEKAVGWCPQCMHAKAKETAAFYLEVAREEVAKEATRQEIESEENNAM